MLFGRRIAAPPGWQCPGCAASTSSTSTTSSSSCWCVTLRVYHRRSGLHTRAGKTHDVCTVLCFLRSIPQVGYGVRWRAAPGLLRRRAGGPRGVDKLSRHTPQSRCSINVWRFVVPWLVLCCIIPVRASRWSIAKRFHFCWFRVHCFAAFARRRMRRVAASFDWKIAHVIPAFCLVNTVGSCAGLLRRAQEQMSKRIVEQIVDVPVPQILHQIVDVPVPQIMGETVEAVNVPLPQIQEQIVEVVNPLLIAVHLFSSF